MVALVPRRHDHARRWRQPPDIQITARHADPRTVMRPDAGCPVGVAIAATSGRWTILVLRELMHDLMSFGDLSTALPQLSDKVLNERLRRLCSQRLVERRSIAGFPSRVTYALTRRGQQLRTLLIELYRTGLHLQQLAS